MSKDLDFFVKLLPEMITVFTVFLNLTMAVFLKKKSRLVELLPFFGVFTAFIVTLFGYDGNSTVFFNGLIIYDSFSHVMRIVVFLLGALILLLPKAQLGVGKDRTPELHSLVLAVIWGLAIFIDSGSLLVSLVALEIVSISKVIVYSLSSRERVTTEAAMKTFLFGAMSTVFFCLGICAIWLSTGSFMIEGLSSLVVKSADQSLNKLAFLSFLFSIGSLVGFFPFHFLKPDQIEGSPVVVTGLELVTTFIIAVVAMVRIFFQGFMSHVDQRFSPVFFEAWPFWFSGLAAMTMLIGSIMAYRQKSVKRILGYLLVSEVGILCLGACLVQAKMVSIMIAQAFSYACSFLGLCLVLAHVSKDRVNPGIESLDGLFWKSRSLGVAVLICVFNLSGLPPFPVFFTQFEIFGTALKEGYFLIAAIAIVNWIITTGAFLKIISRVLRREGQAETSSSLVMNMSERVALVSILMPLPLLYFFWNPIYHVLTHSISTIRW